MSRRVLPPPPPQEPGAGWDLDTATQVIVEMLGAEPVSQMGEDWLTEGEVAEKVGDLAEAGVALATWMADEVKTSRRLFMVRCGGCGELFFRSSGPGGYKGTSTWKGGCPSGCKTVRDEAHDEWIGELT